MYFSQMIACEADQYTDTEFLSAMNDVITMETLYVLEASYSISTFFRRIWGLISGIFKFIYNIIAGAINFIKVKILGKPANREVTVRPVSTDNDGMSATKQVTSVISAISDSNNKIKVPIDADTLEMEIKYDFAHVDGELYNSPTYFVDLAMVVGGFIDKLRYKYEYWGKKEFDYSFDDYCNENNMSFLKRFIDTPPNKIIYTEAIKEHEIEQSRRDAYWLEVNMYLESLRSNIPHIKKHVDNAKCVADKYDKTVIDLVTTKFPGAIDDFLKFVNMLSLHFNQFKNVVAEISKVVMSSTNIFKQQ